MKFNLSDWALEHRSFVWFLMAIAVVAGVMSYQNLGREEDPAFAIKTMVVQAYWPGASVDDTRSQVTERIERALDSLDTLDFTRSYTTAGQSTIFVNLKETLRGTAVTDSWYQVRKKVNDIAREFPSGLIGPFFNDEFGSVYGSIYAFTADGLSYRQLRDYVETVRSEVLSLADTGRVELIGTQDEVISVDFSTAELATLGISAESVIKQLQAQNAITPAGTLQANGERVLVRVGGQFTSEADLERISLQQGDVFFRLADVATISRGYQDPPDPLFRFNGQPALGLGISMAASGDILKFGEALDEKMHEIEAELPVGVGVEKVSDQPHVVEEAVGGFTKSLIEAIVIVLVVSFISLGLRAGLVVAISIPLVLALVFVFMEFMGISLQRVSLGALIIALGLLVDDAMITVEMMVSRLEAGDSLRKAATFAYTSTAFPMLTGTLVTVAGFLPILLNASTAGEYVSSLFYVIAAALIISWVVAVLFAPLVGVVLLPKTMKGHHEKKPGRFDGVFVRTLETAMRFRWVTIGATIGLFALSVVGLGFVQQQFFPASDRPEIMVDFTLPQNATIRATEAAMDRFEASLKGDPDIARWSSYVGQGAVRFYLPMDSQLANPFFGQVVIVTNDLAARGRVRAKIDALLAKDFADLNTFVQFLELGPPVGRPIQYRVSGADVQTLRGLAHDLAALISQNPHLRDISFDWNEPAKQLLVNVDQDKARRLGVTSENVAQVLNTVVNGTTITQVRDSIYLIDVVARAEADQRNSLETLQNLQVQTSSGVAVPLGSFSTIEYGLTQPIIWQRERVPTITVRASVTPGILPAAVDKELADEIKAFAAKLPVGYAVAPGGAAESSAKSTAALVATLPAMLLAMAFVLMVQLQSISKLFLVVSVAPLGVIGVVAALLPTGTPLGFVALLGVLALAGIIIRNAVILIGQIDDNLAEGRAPWEAVVHATEHRMRPILLTAAAASLGMIPIASEVFWGPMAYAMIGGIVAATVLTLYFLPALYVAWYRVKAPPVAPAAEPAPVPAA
ncbi:efflux RND transporter permease subunit [Devosia sp.]|uniref:efflux RND transporter permease subunit n=1 Tax=Devosia sp. TaxID=1871048 RepID=UPI0037C11552